MKRIQMVLIALLSIFSASAAVALTIDTTPGDSSIVYFGEPDTATYGQTFLVSAGETVLDSFEFTVTQDSVNAVDFQFFVMAWDQANLRAMGSVLYASAVQQTVGGGPETFSFLPGINLTAGNQYVGFINNSALQPGIPPDGGSLSMSASSGNPYLDGAFVFLNNGSDFSRTTIDSWTTDWQGQGSDTAFKAVFSRGQGEPVPDSGATALMLMGSLFALVTVRRELVKV